jgi:ribulose-phosphate 3-epimerase
LGEDPLFASVSLWSADLLAVGAAVDLVDAVADGYHLDIFDGHNIPDLLFGPDFVAALRKRTAKPIDVHLMVTDPDYWAKRFVEAGADMVTVQSDTTSDIEGTLDGIRALGAKASLGLEVHEPTEHAASLFGRLDRVLLMGTAIGIKGVGQHPGTDDRVAELVAHRAAAGRTPADLPVFVDGAIRDHTVPGLAAAGCDGVIPGSFVFGVDDPVASIEYLHSLHAHGNRQGQTT